MTPLERVQPLWFNDNLVHVHIDGTRPGEELPPAGRPHDPAVLAQAAAKVGIEILGPPGVLPTG